MLLPEEAHDGRAGTPDGFAYRIVYVSPVRIQEAARAICGRPCTLPFVREPLAIDGLILCLAEALLAADPSCGEGATPIHLDRGAVTRARQFLDAETIRVIRSSGLEDVTGLTRYDLARQFRSAFGTSPYRYVLMRRLDCARVQLRRNRSLADAALAAGFADQAHLSRMFRYAFGVTPARYRALEANNTR